MENRKMTGQMLSPARVRLMKILRVLMRIGVGALFIVAGAAKAYDPGTFATEIQRYNLIPWTPGAFTAVYLPWLEILAGLLLVLERFERGALLLITCLLVVFTLALASATVRGLSIDCGCFGKAFAATGTVIPLVRNVLLLAFTSCLWAGNQ